MKYLLLLTAFALIPPAALEVADAAWHGLSVRLAPEGRLVVAVCRYDGDVAVTGAEVRVFAPEAEEPYQTGRTDAAGHFAFLPSHPGSWRVLVDDGQGHRREGTIEVTEQRADEAGSDRLEAVAPAPAESRLWPLLTGLSLIIGLTGLAYGFTARRQKDTTA